MPEFFKRQRHPEFHTSGKILGVLEDILEELKIMNYYKNRGEIQDLSPKESKDKLLDKNVLIKNPEFIPQVSTGIKSRFNINNDENSKILDFDVTNIAKSMENKNENR